MSSSISNNLSPPSSASSSSSSLPIPSNPNSTNPTLSLQPPTPLPSQSEPTSPSTSIQPTSIPSPPSPSDSSPSSPTSQEIPLPIPESGNINIVGNGLTSPLISSPWASWPASPNLNDLPSGSAGSNDEEGKRRKKSIGSGGGGGGGGGGGSGGRTGLKKQKSNPWLSNTSGSDGSSPPPSESLQLDPNPSSSNPNQRTSLEVSSPQSLFPPTNHNHNVSSTSTSSNTSPSQPEPPSQPSRSSSQSSTFTTVETTGGGGGIGGAVASSSWSNWSPWGTPAPTRQNTPKTVPLGLPSMAAGIVGNAFGMTAATVTKGGGNGNGGDDDDGGGSGGGRSKRRGTEEEWELWSKDDEGGTTKKDNKDKGKGKEKVRKDTWRDSMDGKGGYEHDYHSKTGSIWSSNTNDNNDQHLRSSSNHNNTSFRKKDGRKISDELLSLPSHSTNTNPSTPPPPFTSSSSPSSSSYSHLLTWIPQTFRNFTHRRIHSHPYHHGLPLLSPGSRSLAQQRVSGGWRSWLNGGRRVTPASPMASYFPGNGPPSSWISSAVGGKGGSSSGSPHRHKFFPSKRRKSPSSLLSLTILLLLIVWIFLHHNPNGSYNSLMRKIPFINKNVRLERGSWRHLESDEWRNRKMGKISGEDGDAKRSVVPWEGVLGGGNTFAFGGGGGGGDREVSTGLTSPSHSESLLQPRSRHSYQDDDDDNNDQNQYQDQFHSPDSADLSSSPTSPYRTTPSDLPPIIVVPSYIPRPPAPRAPKGNEVPPRIVDPPAGFYQSHEELGGRDWVVWDSDGDDSDGNGVSLKSGKARIINTPMPFDRTIGERWRKIKTTFKNLVGAGIPSSNNHPLVLGGKSKSRFDLPGPFRVLRLEVYPRVADLSENAFEEDALPGHSTSQKEKRIIGERAAESILEEEQKLGSLEKRAPPPRKPVEGSTSPKSSSSPAPQIPEMGEILFGFGTDGLRAMRMSTLWRMYMLGGDWTGQERDPILLPDSDPNAPFSDDSSSTPSSAWPGRPHCLVVLPREEEEIGMVGEVEGLFEKAGLGPGKGWVSGESALWGGMSALNVSSQDWEEAYSPGHLHVDDLDLEDGGGRDWKRSMSDVDSIMSEENNDNMLKKRAPSHSMDDRHGGCVVMGSMELGKAAERKERERRWREWVESAAVKAREGMEGEEEDGSRWLNKTDVEREPEKFTIRILSLISYMRAYADSLDADAEEAGIPKDQRKPLKWFVIGDDDTYWTDSLTLRRMLARYDPNEMHFIGTTSEAEEPLYVFKRMAFGGAGIVLSRPVLEAMDDIWDACYHEFKHYFGGDEMITDCAAYVSGKPRGTDLREEFLEEESGMRQLDVHGSGVGFLQGGFEHVSMHHVAAKSIWLAPFPSWHPLSPLVSQNLLLGKVAKFLGGDNMFRRFVFGGGRQLLVLGYTVTWFEEPIPQTDWQKLEHTWRSDWDLRYPVRPWVPEHSFPGSNRAPNRKKTYYLVSIRVYDRFGREIDLEDDRSIPIDRIDNNGEALRTGDGVAIRRRGVKAVMRHESEAGDGVEIVWDERGAQFTTS